MRISIGDENSQKKRKLYCISGLGADHRVFSYINSNKYELVIIPWIKSRKNETLSNYAKRLTDANSISEQSDILGVSFGGVIAIEIAKIIEIRKIFLVSSITTDAELPNLLKVLGRIKLFWILPNFLMNPPRFISFYIFGVTSKEHKKLLVNIINDTDVHFLKWALQNLSQWKQKNKIHSIRIHGSKDKLFYKKLNRKIDCEIKKWWASNNSNSC